jgi:hypothetical protein
MNLISYSMVLGFPSPHLDMPGLGQGLYSRPWTALGMRIYEKSVSLVRPNPKVKPNWQLFGKMSVFNEDFGSLMPSLSLTLNVEP